MEAADTGVTRARTGAETGVTEARPGAGTGARTGVEAGLEASMENPEAKLRDLQTAGCTLTQKF